MPAVSSPSSLVEILGAVVAAPPAALRLAVCTAIAGGHLLVEDLPGVGKTLLARTMAQALGLGFRRIQFSPDLMPGDLTGVQIFVPADASFRFQPGPVFTHVLLADEINRASPRTQAGLLEAMEEGQVSADGTTYPLPHPFFVIATQNPLHYEGTYPLPEVQLDRFMAAISLGYPSLPGEMALLEGRHGRHIPLQQVDSSSLLAWRAAAEAIHVDESLRTYMIGVARASRLWPLLSLGISPRGTLAWQALARAHAYLAGRPYMVPDDLKDTAQAALAHRIIPREASGNKGSILADLLDREPVPR